MNSLNLILTVDSLGPAAWPEGTAVSLDVSTSRKHENGTRRHTFTDDNCEERGIDHLHGVFDHILSELKIQAGPLLYQTIQSCSLLHHTHAVKIVAKLVIEDIQVTEVPREPRAN